MDKYDRLKIGVKKEMRVWAFVAILLDVCCGIIFIFNIFLPFLFIFNIALMLMGCSGLIISAMKLFNLRTELIMLSLFKELKK